MVLESGIFDHLPDDDTSLEADALEQVASARNLAAFRRDRLWQCMDTLREKRYLEALGSSGKAPWRH
jgi:glucose-1-phosphate cytidylyltransferase